MTEYVVQAFNGVNGRPINYGSGFLYYNEDSGLSERLDHADRYSDFNQAIQDATELTKRGVSSYYYAPVELEKVKEGTKVTEIVEEYLVRVGNKYGSTTYTAPTDSSSVQKALELNKPVVDIIKSTREVDSTGKVLSDSQVTVMTLTRHDITV